MADRKLDQNRDQLVCRVDRFGEIFIEIYINCIYGVSMTCNISIAEEEKMVFWREKGALALLPPILQRACIL